MTFNWFMASSQPSLPSTQASLSLPYKLLNQSWNARFPDKNSAGISHLPKHVICLVISSTFISAPFPFYEISRLLEQANLNPLITLSTTPSMYINFLHFTYICSWLHILFSHFLTYCTCFCPLN